MNLGEYVAENEARDLDRYYVETSTFREVLTGSSRVYVGSKGTGKSATVIQAESAIRADKRNLVCSIKPAGYDLNGLIRLLSNYSERDVKGYLAESLWKYLLATELALSVERDLASRPAGVMPDGPEWRLLQFIAANDEWLKTDFASRLERAVDALLRAPTHDKLADQRQQISEALHAGPLRKLREVLAPALAVRTRVFIIVDNLDKSWDRGAEVDQLTRLILGLLSSMDAFRSDLERAAGKEGLALSLSLFIRSDIYASVSAMAREPDKLPVKRINWPGEVPLLAIVEARYAASREQTPVHGELWEKYFCTTVGSERTVDWILRVCLPRPRDILYLCKAAIDHALSVGNPVVQAADLLAAERQYSLFAFEAATVESQHRVPRIDDVLIEFAGASTSLPTDQVQAILTTAGIETRHFESTIDVLRDVSFLGVQTGDGQVSFTDSPREKRLADVLANRIRSAHHTAAAYAVHPAFWAYLELERDEQRLRLDF